MSVTNDENEQIKSLLTSTDTIGTIDLREGFGLWEISTEAIVADSFLFWCIGVASQERVTCKHSEALGESKDSLLIGGIPSIVSLPVKQLSN